MGNHSECHVRALSGGGYRGLYTAQVLAELEAEMGAPLASHFDLICGTSIGGILALGLANEIPASNLVKLFDEHKEKIFRHTPCPKVLKFTPKLASLYKKIFTVKYMTSGLREVLTDNFSNNTIGDLKHCVLITAVNCITGKPQFFKTPHHSTLIKDHNLSLVDVALATSAAPTYFPLAKIERGIFADGGLVGNAPGFFGYHEIKKYICPEAKKVRVLSIGTLSKGFGIKGSSKTDLSLFDWKDDLISLIFSAQESSTDFLLKHLLEEDYFVIDGHVSVEQQGELGLDKINDGATNLLKYMAQSSAQNAIGNAKFKPFLEHVAVDPKFYYGPNKTLSED